MIVAPFPFTSLPKVSRAEIAAARAARGLPIDAFARALAAVIDADVTIAVRRARPAERAAMTGVVAAFSPVDHDALYVAEAEAALARELVLRALKQPPGRIVDPARAASGELHGAFAAVVLAAARRVTSAPLRVVGVSAGAIEPGGTTAWLAVTVAGATFDARVTFPGAFPPAPRIDELPIALPIVAAECLATRGELESLRAGDVLVPPRLQPLGRVALVAPRAERGVAADLAEGGRLVLRTSAPSTAHPWDMVDPNAPLEAALDAPVVVRVELGAVEMPARAWAELADGDVITLGKKLGEHAVLRVGGVEVARGELVQVDGEYGIRIVGLSR